MADFPDGLSMNTNDSAGDVSASVEETNRVRAALGLKPLKEGKSAGAAVRQQEENEAHKRKQAEAAATADAAQLAARVAEARERRAVDEKLRKTKTLADDDPAEDDAEAWVERSRRVVEERRKAEEKKKAEEQRRRLEEQDESDDDDDDAPKGKGPKYTAKDLAGLAVSHGLEAMDAGESMILTLKDSRILNEADLDEDDMLENVRVAELKKREKALKAAKKTTSFEEPDDSWERKTLLGKYDEKADEKVTLDESGAVDAAKKAKQEEVKRRLAVAAAGGVAAITGKEESADVGGAAKAQADFFTSAEMEQFNKPKKLRKKKAGRKKEGLDAAELEAIVRAEAGDDDGDGAGAGAGRSADLGRRKDVKEALDAAKKAQEEGKYARFEAAKSRAAADSVVAFKRGGAQEEEDDAAIGGDDDADNELYAAMERSRRSALAGQAARTGGVDSVVQSVKASAAAAASAGGAKASASGANLDLDFSDTAEFVRNISVEKAHALARGVEAARQTGIVIPGVKEEPAAAAAAAGGNNDGDAEMRNADAGEFIPLGDDEDGGGGGVKKEEGGGAAAAAGPSAEEQEELVSAAEQAIGEEIKASRGLGSVLAMLKQKNQLTEAITWSGRNTDKQPHRVKEKVEAEQVETVDDKFKFGFSLDRYDEFGRKLTPKEAFRELCWKFHGMPPGKMKQEKRLKQWHEEQRRLSMKEGDTPTGAMEKLREAQARVNAPYVILSGSVSAGQVSDSNSMYATLEKDAPAAAPALTRGALGSQQALTGAKKVEFMMGRGGAKRGPGAEGAGEGTMLPPPPKRPRAAP